jgi:cellulose synthase/poly-beta-1,6-N-acetylglucosamine synthase-like glycosyltransferase
MTTHPLVSVVLSVHNGAADLPRAVDTILAQTFRDFELIAINNGSTDGTAAVLDDLRDPRVRVVHQDDMGLAAALNRGIAMARGRYVARQDHDDWAKPTRLEKQVAFLESNPDCALVGTRAEIWVGDQKTERVHDHPIHNAALQFELLFDNPFVHSSMMLRRSALDAVGGYSTDCSRQPPEDYELWSRIARRYKVANLPERLTIYREVPRSLSRVGPNPFQEKILLISSENLAHATGDAGPDQRHRDVAALIHRVFHVVSADPDIEQLCGVVSAAGKRFAWCAPDSCVQDRIQARIANLRRNYGAARLERSLGPLSSRMSWARRIPSLRWLRRQIARLRP